MQRTDVCDYTDHIGETTDSPLGYAIEIVADIDFIVILGRYIVVALDYIGDCNVITSHVDARRKKQMIYTNCIRALSSTTNKNTSVV